IILRKNTPVQISCPLSMTNPHRCLSFGWKEESRTHLRWAKEKLDNTSNGIYDSVYHIISTFPKDSRIYFFILGTIGTGLAHLNKRNRSRVQTVNSTLHA
ncbi:MAG: hypothetical protein ACE1ZS_09720, partial [Candidatus Poribacteria bacterium]